MQQYLDFGRGLSTPDDGDEVGAVKGTHRKANQECTYLGYVERELIKQKTKFS
jgi:hypothetical protein